MLSRKEIEPTHFNHMVGDSDIMTQVYNLIETVAPTNASVMIVGETGTGKEMTARTIHHLSRRKNQPFIAINCPAISDNLWKSEVFGHERGAFTGAVSMKKGMLEMADKGTFFLTKFPKCPSLSRPDC